MTVYVDDARNKYRGMIMSHMIADSLDELHDMASTIGLKRSWFQNTNNPHYDVCQERKKIAISLGAKQITVREAIVILRRNRNVSQTPEPA